MEIERLEKQIQYSFKNRNLLKTALTHKSYAYENGIESNEKLEFLGDSILEFVTSEYLFENYTNLSEGEMTKVRAAVVCEESLYKLACKHNFSDFLYLGKSEKISQTYKNAAILADSVEAIIAAMYLDSGIEEVSKFILSNLIKEMKVASKNVGMKDYKTVLQEKLQEKGEVDIKYTVINEKGPDHNKIFTVELHCNGELLSTGEGTTKKMAEMEAAKKALEKVKK